MYTILCTAITLRQVLRFSYHGGERIVEPFCYGVSAAGHELLRAFQLGGQSLSGSPLGWKLFRVEEIQDLRVDTRFRPNYNPNDPAMATIFCRV